MRKINKLEDISVSEYFKLLSVMDDMNTKKTSAKDGITDLTKVLLGVDVNVDKLSAKYVETLVGSAIQAINSESAGEFNKIVSIKGVLYGIEPAFETMEAGAYHDVCTYIDQKEYVKALAILYRPISKTYMERRYDIASYVEESDNAFAYRVYLIENYLTAADARGVLNFFVNSPSA